MREQYVRRLIYAKRARARDRQWLIATVKSLPRCANRRWTGNEEEKDIADWCRLRSLGARRFLLGFPLHWLTAGPWKGCPRHATAHSAFLISFVLRFWRTMRHFYIPPRDTQKVWLERSFNSTLSTSFRTFSHSSSNVSSAQAVIQQLSQLKSSPAQCVPL